MNTSSTFTANRLLPGQQGMILEVLQGESTIRLMEMGFLPGTVIRLITQAPGQGAMAFQVNRTLFALRPQEAELLLLTTHED